MPTGMPLTAAPPVLPQHVLGVTLVGLTPETGLKLLYTAGLLLAKYTSR